MKVQQATASKPTKTFNDDLAGDMGRCFWLMDGATQLHQPAHGLTASWHVGQLAAGFRRLLAEDPDMDLALLAKKSIAATAQQFFDKSGMTSADPMMERPFCTLILCRLNDAMDSLEYLLLCDSTLLVQSGDKAQVITDGRQDDVQALRETNALLVSGQGFDTPAYKAALLEAYHHVFRHLNKPEGGWYAVAQDENVVDHALRGNIPITSQDNIFLMSDGFTRAVDTLGMYPDFSSLTTDIQKTDLSAIIDRIRDVEREDGEGQCYPRSSRHDDATALWVQVD